MAGASVGLPVMDFVPISINEVSEGVLLLCVFCLKQKRVRGEWLTCKGPHDV